MPTPYERIDTLEAELRALIAKVDRIAQHPALSVPPLSNGPEDKAIPGSTLHLPAKAKH